jgi:hypothetical protein
MTIAALGAKRYLARPATAAEISRLAIARAVAFDSLRAGSVPRTDDIGLAKLAAVDEPRARVALLAPIARHALLACGSLAVVGAALSGGHRVRLVHLKGGSRARSHGSRVVF